MSLRLPAVPSTGPHRRLCQEPTPTAADGLARATRAPAGTGPHRPRRARRAPAPPRLRPVPHAGALRIQRGRVETAVWSLVHPVTGRQATLVGTMHIGDATYFRALSGILARLAGGGAEIHVEGIHRTDEGTLSPGERARLAEAEAWDDPERTGAAVSLLSLESQGGHLELPEGFRNVDMSHVQLLRRVGWDTYRRLLAPDAPGPAPALGPVVRAVIRFQLRHSPVIDRLRALWPRNRRVRRVVIDERNRIAFAAASAALAQGDVALVWGTDHLPGLAALFRASGYELRSEAWFQVCLV